MSRDIITLLNEIEKYGNLLKNLFFLFQKELECQEKGKWQK
ncbi:hypothetical protein [Bacillus cereus]|nr:hypothetical protein [Bacillus cereus]